MTAPLERAVEVMDRLRSPGGCPWDAAQTHESLARYLLEETYEVLEAIETNDPALLREELGDLLLQVLFHARLAQDDPTPFSVDDVADDLVAKLIRRHPHVFAPSEELDALDVNERWEQQKITEKGRTSAVDGVPIAQPALALAAKLVARAQRAGLDVGPGDVATGDVAPGDARGEESVAEDDEIGARLFAVVRDAVARGVDPEGALRRTTRTYREAILRAEAAARS